MTPDYKKIHNLFKINSSHLDKLALLQLATSYIKEGEEFEKEIGLFLLDWLDENDFIITQTSGTTGKPKPIEIKKQAMVNSAIATGNFFNINPGDKALHCLPSKFIAGKMMLVRAIILGLDLDLISPNTRLENNDKVYDFAAMVPLQVENNFTSLDQIKKIIIGGAPPSVELVSRLKALKNIEVFETYGMTETITHIAAKEIHADYFEILPGISIETDERECLVIKAPRITSEKIITNDLVEILSKNRFKWLGRIDNVINSGGVKLFPEQIEKKIQQFISGRFFVSSETEEKLGNKLILIIEGNPITLDINKFNTLSKYERPKEIYFVERFSETRTGKINRNETLKKVRTAR